MVVLSSIIVSAVVIVSIGYALLKLVGCIQRRRRFIALIEKIPGPSAWPLIGNAARFSIDRIKFANEVHQDAIDYTTMGHGMFRYWIGPSPMVIIGAPDGVESILSSHSVIDKSNNYDILVPWLGTGLLISGGSKWRRRRKMLTPTFHFNVLKSFFHVFVEQADILVECLDKHADTDVTFDVFPYVKRCALDVICETAMGTSVNAQRHLESTYVRAVGEITEITFAYNRMPWLWFPPLFYALGYGGRYNACLKLLTDFTRNVITTRQCELGDIARERGVPLADLRLEEDDDDDGGGGSRRKRLAFLDLLICMAAEHGLGEEDIREEVDTFMFEGHDTTSSGIGFALYQLGNHPEFQANVHAELDEVFGSSDRPITNADLDQLPYLHRVIKESLRTVPPVPLFARTLKEDTMIGTACPVTFHARAGGYLVPAGTIATVCPAMLHVYGAPDEWLGDPREFNPDNFLKEHSMKRHPYAYVPFSAGPRNCIGQKFAQNEEKVILANLLRRYRFEAMLPLDSDAIRPLPEIISRPYEGFPMKIFKRKHVK